MRNKKAKAIRAALALRTLDYAESVVEDTQAGRYVERKFDGMLKALKLRKKGRVEVAKAVLNMAGEGEKTKVSPRIYRKVKRAWARRNKSVSPVNAKAVIVEYQRRKAKAGNRKPRRYSERNRIHHAITARLSSHGLNKAVA